MSNLNLNNCSAPYSSTVSGMFNVSDTSLDILRSHFPPILSFSWSPGPPAKVSMTSELQEKVGRNLFSDSESSLARLYVGGGERWSSRVREGLVFTTYSSKQFIRYFKWNSMSFQIPLHFKQYMPDSQRYFKFFMD